jgi:SPP1 family predicted phage head-tail adaptor
MQAGRLRHRVTVQRATDSIDQYGDQTPTWTSLGTVWASVEPLSGREYFAAAQMQSEVSTRIVIRPISGVTLTPKDRVKFGSRYFDIQSVINRDERNRELQLLCVERFT